MYNSLSLASLEAYLARLSAVLLQMSPEWPLTLIQLTKYCLSIERWVICSMTLGDFVIWRILAVENFLMPSMKACKSVNILTVVISIGKASRDVQMATSIGWRRSQMLY